MFTPTSTASSFDDDPANRRELLLKVYGSALDEYRFNVQLGWDRSKFYLTISTTAIAAGVGLMKLSSDSVSASLFLAAYFGLLIGLTYLGYETLLVSKRYYRQALLTKTLVERELGLFKPLQGLEEDADMHLAIAVTPGMRDWVKVITAHRARQAKQIDKGSVQDRMVWVFWVLIGIELLGVGLSFSNFAYLVTLPVHVSR